MSDPWEHLDKSDAPSAAANREAFGRVADQVDPTWRARDPFNVASAFLDGLSDLIEYRDVLDAVVTPESLPDWGDFEPAKALLESIEQRGYGTVPNPAAGDPDVVYVKILRGVQRDFRSESEQAVRVAAVVTLVWRPDRGLWMVHHLGNPVLPELVPHG